MDRIADEMRIMKRFVYICQVIYFLYDDAPKMGHNMQIGAILWCEMSDREIQP